MSSTRWPPERDEQLRALWAAGWSAGKIAKELTGVSRCAVIGRARRMGLARRNRQPVHRVERAKPRHRPKPRERIKMQLIRGPEPPPAPAPLPPQCKPVHFMDLANHHCRYPLWEDGSDWSERMFCGATAQEGSSWCPYHHELTTAEHMRHRHSPMREAA